MAPQPLPPVPVSIESTRSSFHHNISLQPDDGPADDQVLNALGYKQDFKRQLGFFTCFSVSFSMLGLVPSIASILAVNLADAGPAGCIWSWLFAGTMIQSVVLSMAELASSMPTDGGLYYAAARLAPDKYGPLAAWVTGWSNFIGIVTAPCSINYALANMMLTARRFVDPNFNIQNWQVYLLFLLLVISEAAITTLATKILGRVNTVGAVVNLATLLIFVLWLPPGSINTPKTNSTLVTWTEVVNGTEWPDGFAVLMSSVAVIYTMAGYDAPFHLSEECSNASVAVPRAICLTGLLGLLLGFPIILVIAYTVSDLTGVLGSEYGQPMGSLCLQVLGQRAGLGMFSIIIVAQYFVAISCNTAASRVVYAYSRDGALPFSRLLKQVNRRTRTPIYAVWLVGIIGALQCLLLFAGAVAINAVFSVVAIAQYAAYITPISMKLFFGHKRFQPGPWNLGRYSRPINAVAVAWVGLMIPVLCFPTVKGKSLSAQTMNYTSLLYGGVMTLSLIWYAVDARKWFVGPKANLTYEGTGAAQVLDGVDPPEDGEVQSGRRGEKGN